MRCSTLVICLISPESPTSPAMQIPDGMAMSTLEDNMAHIMGKMCIRDRFITTANTLSSISQPLLDRMEIIDISGYLIEEKVEIAKRHLLPRVLKANTLTKRNFNMSDDAFVKIIEGYTCLLYTSRCV